MTVLSGFQFIIFVDQQGIAEEKVMPMVGSEKIVSHLKTHLKKLTLEIGERSVNRPDNLERTAAYIESFYSSIGLISHREPYQYRDFTVANVISEISLSSNPCRCYLLGAHYDSVTGTVGADDNASAIAVQLETARRLKNLEGQRDIDLTVKFVSFALEEPPVFPTGRMGSKVYAKKAKAEGEKIDGMLCLEMVGYTCERSGCQSYPFPLMFMGYPKKGNFIGIVGNSNSSELTRDLFEAFKKNRELPVERITVPFSGWLMPAVRLSDHASFWDQGFKAVMVTDTSFYRNPHYHMSSDTMERLDYRFMAELVESLVIFFQSHGA